MANQRLGPPHDESSRVVASSSRSRRDEVVAIGARPWPYRGVVRTAGVLGLVAVLGLSVSACSKGSSATATSTTASVTTSTTAATTTTPSVEDAAIAVQTDAAVGCLVVDWGKRGLDGKAAALIDMMRRRGLEMPIVIMVRRKRLEDIPVELLDFIDAQRALIDARIEAALARRRLDDRPATRELRGFAEALERARHALAAMPATMATATNTQADAPSIDAWLADRPDPVESTA